MATFSWTSLFTNQTITRAQFITNLRTRIDEDTADIITDSQIQNLIKAGDFDISFRSLLLPEYATVSADGSSSYSLPTDLTELHELYHISADSTPVYRTIISTNLMELNDKGYDTGTPEYYIRNGQQIEVFGSAISTGTFRLYGTRVPTFPSTDAGYIDLPDTYLELMYLWCEWKFWVRRREPDEAALARDLYITMAQQVADQVKEQYFRGATAYG